MPGSVMVLGPGLLIGPDLVLDLSLVIGPGLVLDPAVMNLNSGAVQR